MSRKIVAYVLAAMIVTLAASCGTGDKRRATPTPAADAASVDAAVKGSGWAFGQTTSFRIKFIATSAGVDGRIEGDADYRLGTALHARTNVLSKEVGEGDLAGLLLLPPDLYVQLGDGSWFVQSPWNQGIRPGEEQGLGIGLDRPIVDYTQMSQHVRELELVGSERVDGVEATRYRGTILESDLAPPEAGGDANLSDDIEIWLRADNGLPLKVVLGTGGAKGYSVTVEFSDYDRDVTPPATPKGARPLRDAAFPDAPCIGDALAGCLAVQNGIRGADDCPATVRRVCLAPLGQVPPELVKSLVAYYKQVYDLDVTVLRPSTIPASLEDPLRQQIDADGLINYMAALYPAATHNPNSVLIGLTVVDLYDATSHFRYVFGLKRNAREPKAVISTMRMDPRFYSEAEDKALLTTRVRKLLSKYVGLLMWGLPTSSDPTSPMYDSILGTRDVDRMTEPLPVPQAR